MRRFRKKKHLSIVIIPPHGRVYDHDILVGDQYAQYAPFMLEELPEEGPVPPLAEPEETGTFKPRPNPLDGELAKAAAETVPVPVEEQLPPPPDEIFVPELADSAAPSETATVEAAPVDEPPKKKRGRPRKVKPVEPTTEEASKE
jgi:hypothetical protein